MTNEVKFHRIEGSGREWIEYPTDMYIVDDPQTEGYKVLVCVDVLRDQPALVQELKEMYGTEIDVVERWIRIEVLRTPTGKIVKHNSIIHSCTPPIIREGFTHSLSFHGKDENYLKFIKWDIEKKLADRAKLAKLDVKTEEAKDERNVAEGLVVNKSEMQEPSFKIEGGEHKGEVELPHFHNAENKQIDSTFKRMDEVFDSMEQLINDFFGKF